MISTIITALIIAAICGAIIVNMYRNKKKGKCSCGCSGCSMSEVCHRDE